ncbi:MAG TPA: TetR/AcrR family transcriptional regulator C-terminal domain-containing protein [Actinomycetota bacterium]|nr:TetR/AcrR family transcriptional regulator C-terminal domain-containing protein [Actinomycetota bacterium]
MKRTTTAGRGPTRPAARTEERRRTRPAPLTRRRVLEAAVRLMDREGLEAVTMRRLGRELGVEAMSLYNHVESKEDLLAGMLDVVLSEFELREGEGGDWPERVRALARAFRRLLHRHPGLIRLLAEEHEGTGLSPEALRPVEEALATLREAGLSEEATVHAYRALVGFTLGSVLLELGGFLSDASRQGAAWAESLLRLAPERLPTFAAILPHLLRCDPDEEFEFGLDVLLGGLRARLSGSTARRR